MTKEKPIRGRIQLWANTFQKTANDFILRMVRPDGKVEFNIHSTSLPRYWGRSTYTRSEKQGGWAEATRQMKRDGLVFLGNL